MVRVKPQNSAMRPQVSMPRSRARRSSSSGVAAEATRAFLYDPGRAFKPRRGHERGVVPRRELAARGVDVVAARRSDVDGHGGGAQPLLKGPDALRRRPLELRARGRSIGTPVRIPELERVPRDEVHLA